MQRRIALVLAVTLCALSQLCAASDLIRILHLTDVHGWINGHPHSATLKSDFGDMVSLSLRMNEKAAKEGWSL